MPKQPRPPANLVDAVMADVFGLKKISQASLGASIRRHLSGTPYRFPKSYELVASYRRLRSRHAKREDIERLIRGKSVRTDSGIAPVTVLTKPYPCPGRCVYCPREARMPKSYLASEPAAARALSLKFDPYQQVAKRIQALEENGHEAKKIELIVKGGTWSAYPWPYRRRFIQRCFDAANSSPDKGLEASGAASRGGVAASELSKAQKRNESAEYRIIGLTIETRPDWVTPKEIARLRELGVTRVELGVQATDDKILKLTKRGHTVADAAQATALLKNAGFKVDYHFLPGQPGSTPARDVEMFRELFEDPRFRPDMVKLYPCVVLPSAELAQWHKAGQFQPLEGEALIEALIKMKVIVPYYCRIPRVIRDFPAQDIAGGNSVTNLRDVIKKQMAERGLVCRCLRCREAGHRGPWKQGTKTTLFADRYENAGGIEYFLSLENPGRTTCLSFLRLRLPDQKTKPPFPELRGCALVRELHTYGQALRIGESRTRAVQHKGLGRRLMKEAERIARANGFKRIAVISGIGVRAYYRGLGYRLAGTYMRKNI